MKRPLTVLALAGLLLFGLVPAALAEGLGGDRVVFGESVTIAEGETLDGNLIVFGGDVTVEAGAEITQDVIVFGGSATVDGRVAGDVVLFGGSARLGDTAVIEGQLATLGGAISKAQGAVIRGGESQGFEFDGGNGPDFRFWPFDMGFSLFAQMVRVVLTAIALSALALLVMLFWPVQTQAVAETVQRAPAHSGGMGLLTYIAVGSVLVVLGITICLLPFSLLGGLVLAGAALFGWIGLGLLVGNRLLAGLNVRDFTPPVSAAVGTLLLSLVSDLFGLIPCVGWLIPVALSSIGLGAVVLTRFGTRPYLPAGPVALTPTSPPPPPDAPVG